MSVIHAALYIITFTAMCNTCASMWYHEKLRKSLTVVGIKIVVMFLWIWTPPRINIIGYNLRSNHLSLRKNQRRKNQSDCIDLAASQISYKSYSGGMCTESWSKSTKIISHNRSFSYNNMFYTMFKSTVYNLNFPRTL